jgi:hypothetical protein
MKKINALILPIFLLPSLLPALDVSLALDQKANVSGIGTQDTTGVYQADFIPRLSGLLGDISGAWFGNYVITAGVSAGTDEPYIIPELLRSEASVRFGDAKITAGRMQYTSPFAADGLFDGFQFEYDTPLGTFNAGAWYTGLLYKKRANIIMTKEDAQSYSAAMDYGDFAGAYFASRRMVASLGWEHPAINEQVRANAAFIAQFDLNGRNEYLHSQYVTLKAGIPMDQFMFESGGVLELAQTDTGSKIALAGELGFFWMPPTPLTSRLSFTGYFSSGSTDGSLAAFTPITSKTLGEILEAAPSGICALSLDYTARLHQTLSAGLTTTYFIRSDSVTYAGYPLDANTGDNYLLGNEFFARLVWSPFSDLQINLGCGIFLPGMGNAAPDSDPLWRIKIAATAALY